MKKVVSVSLGSSRQDFEFKTKFLGQNFSVHRMGADQDTGKAWELMRRQQATADAIGLGPVLDLTQDPQPAAEVDVTGGPDPVIVDHFTSLARIADA